jgi:hypothetical protein
MHASWTFFTQNFDNVSLDRYLQSGRDFELQPIKVSASFGEHMVKMMLSLLTA